MASSQTDLCNAAIALCGIGVEIANITERSVEAEACRAAYDPTLERLAVKLGLPSMTKRVALALVEEDPVDEFDFSYGIPSDCISPIKIVSGAIPETSDSHIPFKRMNIDGRDVLLCSEDEAQLEYYFRPDDESQFPVLFAEAFEFALAAKIAPRIVEDPQKLGALLQHFAEESKRLAGAIGKNEHFPGKNPESEFTRLR